jgi:2-polyprenyl-3-methyl-5-hydroxy-6-metoxy-1,4-benzoquinol methylase
LAFAAVFIVNLSAIQVSEGRAAFDAYMQWRQQPENAALRHGDALDAYRERLIARGATKADADRAIRLITAYDEGNFYNKIYSGPPEFNTLPNQHLVNAVKDVAPGDALDVGMGQGRNAIYLATRGWAVTGFDVADAGLAVARKRATERGVTVNAVHVSDEEFDFGKARWDLIAIIYAIENRSVHRVREALRPGGLVVIEAGLHDTPDAPFGFQSQELLRIFDGFRILTYVETMDAYDWGPETIRLVRLVAQKPR